MPVLYLVEQGSNLKKDGDTFVVTKDKTVLQQVPAEKVDQVVIFGNVNVTTPVIHYLLLRGIDCAFCSSTGRYHGRLFSTESRFGLLRQSQFRAVSDRDLKLAFAVQFVKGKLSNYRTMLMRYQRDLGSQTLSDTVSALTRSLEKLDRATDVGSAQGIEGYASLAYYTAFRSLLQQDLGFQARVRRPPRDPVNSLLSFGYTLLVYDVQAAIRIVGLDPFLGFLHTTEYSKPSLALDIMEEFRPIIVDSIVLRVVNNGILTASDFQKAEEEGGMVRLTQEAIRRFLQYYEERLLTEVMHPRLNIRVTYRRAIELQVRQISRIIQGQETGYKPYLVK